MARKNYVITINDQPKSKEVYHYTFSRTGCDISCSSGRASVTFCMNSKKGLAEILALDMPIFLDALRKMHLLHFIRHEKELTVNRILVTIDDETAVLDKDTAGFPFLTSMLGNRKAPLPESFRTKEFTETILSKSKSDIDKDLRYVCLYSFLAAQGRSFEYDQFTSTWIAVNAHYNYLMKCARLRYANELGYARYEDIPNGDFAQKGKNKKQGKNIKRMDTGDSKALSALIRYYGCGEKLRKMEERSRPAGLSPEEAREKNYLPQYGKVKTFLLSYSREELLELYRQMYEHRTDRKWVPEGPLGEHLKICQDRCQMSSWGFLLFEYGYYIRCNYLHGSKAPILFTEADDPKLAAFRGLNVFLGEYLKETIPQMFREDWFSEKMYQAVKMGIQ